MSAASSRPNHAHQHFRGQARPKRAVELIIEEVRRLSLSLSLYRPAALSLRFSDLPKPGL